MQKAAFITLALVSAVAFGQNNDSAAYKAAHDKAEATYKSAKKQCDTLKDNAEDVCTEEAKVARAQAERDAVAQHKNTGTELQKADRKLADAKYELAKEKCDDLAGDAKNSCQAQARSMKANATASATADGRTAVLVNNADGSAVAASAADVRDRTAVAAQNAKEKTVEVAQAAKEKTAEMVAATKEKTAEMTQRAKTSETAQETKAKTAELAQATKEKSSEMAQSAREKTAVAAGGAQAVMSDTMITAKVKADMAADRNVKAMDVHVETEKGVVMLSGFVPSKAEADRAVELARGVNGVTEVKSSIQVK
ncbi:osmotically-inducible protein OsmY [Pseudoduganella lurida]|uniref:Osmotically-inducible protein Y n=1 Tax=Pseudoduganella lurida TaxID=1036180 RepID=A0A562R7Y9_9BURK|nr:BON domain-containing protein [Pseudoduganella lurida]TWI64486.1 osmotically-inducible protein OsmY [Pseudoduganella lurida]